MRACRSIIHRTAVMLALIATPVAARGQASAWTLREELRLGNGASIDGLPPIARLVTNRDGHAYALSNSGEVIVFDRAGRVLRRVQTITREQNEKELRELAIERMERLRQELPEGARIQGPITVRSGPPQVTVVDIRMGWVGDTLWLSRFGMRHVALFNASVSGIGTIPFTPEIDGRPANHPLALLADRSLLRTITSQESTTWPPDRVIRPPYGTYQMPVIPAPPLPRDEQPLHGFLLRSAPDGRVLQGLEIFIQPRKPVVIENPYGVTATIPIPFQDHPLIAVTPDGSEIIFVERYRAQRPDQATYSVARFDARTGKRTARPYAYKPVPLTPATGDSLVSRLIDSTRSPITPQFLDGFRSPAAARAAILEDLDIGEYQTPIADVIAGADRSVWLREHVTGSWIVLGRNGDMLGRVTLPSDVRLLHADADTVWGLSERGAGSSVSRALIRYRLVKR
jgi:hypothetical protein